MSDRSPFSKDRPAETCALSVGSLQEFRCAGLPHDSPIIAERERLKIKPPRPQGDADGKSPKTEK